MLLSRSRLGARCVILYILYNLRPIRKSSTDAVAAPQVEFGDSWDRCFADRVQNYKYDRPWPEFTINGAWLMSPIIPILPERSETCRRWQCFSSMFESCLFALWASEMSPRLYTAARSRKTTRGTGWMGIWLDTAMAPGGRTNKASNSCWWMVATPHPE